MSWEGLVDKILPATFFYDIILAERFLNFKFYVSQAKII